MKAFVSGEVIGLIAETDNDIKVLTKVCESKYPVGAADIGVGGVIAHNDASSKQWVDKDKEIIARERP